ncbi:MAG: hypothetical protein Q8902_10620 [Bacteroidota bacterium]|nr:hypothetical protein [Bacteroidota bacterium]MDP4233563.1 hypothetical protein [Bacteroidota bacterium]MDP4243662.1 hypothetical protein [Bacteroidota bacterium]
MKKINVCLCAISIALVVLQPVSSRSQSSAAAVNADIPHAISYQGMLLASDGTALNGLQRITVRLYADAIGKQLVWEDEFLSTVDHGVFDLSLGSNKPLPESARLGVPLWLAIKVGESDELRPMTQLSTSPYALNVANGSITAAKMGTDYVGSISVNGQHVSSRGSDVNFVAGDGLTLAFDPTSNAVLMRSATPVSSKGAASQNQNQDLDMNGHNILNAPTYMAGIASTTSGAIRMYNSASSNYATIVSASQGGNRTYTIPDAGANATFVMQTGSQTISGLKTFSVGATMGGDVNMSSNHITSLAAPSATSDAATKGYADSLSSNALSAIASEANTRSSADSVLTAHLSSEVTNRQAAITSESSSRSAADSTLSMALGAEVTRAEGVESTQATDLNSEITARQSAVTAEASARIAADNTLGTNLNNEVINRQTAISGEASTRASAVSLLTTSLQSETSRATTEENSLQTQINGLTMPQDLSTTASPTFAGLTLSGSPFVNYGDLYQASPSFFYGDLSLYANASIGGTLDMNFQSIIDVADPFFAQDAANKNYVDVLIGQVNSSISTINTSLTNIGSTLSSVDSITANFSGFASGTYSGHKVNVTGSTTNVVDIIGYNAFVSGSDDQNIGIKATGQGSGSGNSIGGDFTGHNTAGTGYAIGGRFAATGAANNIAVQATSGSIQVQTAGEGIILKSPNGTCYKLTVNNDGSLSTSAITCP